MRVQKPDERVNDLLGVVKMAFVAVKGPRALFDLRPLQSPDAVLRFWRRVFPAHPGSAWSPAVLAAQNRDYAGLHRVLSELTDEWSTA